MCREPRYQLCTRRGEHPSSKLSATSSTLAGSFAGAVEIGEQHLDNACLGRTDARRNHHVPGRGCQDKSQLNRQLPVSQKPPWLPFPSKEYCGLQDASSMSSYARTLTGFIAFDSSKHVRADEHGNLSHTRTAIAGLAAGVAESTLAVTPFKSIKTQLIDDKQTPKPLIRRGIRGFYQGFVSSTTRQAANSMVRFTSYTATKERMARSSSMGKVGTNEGVLALLSGSVAQLGRLKLSGAIVFTVYEHAIEFSYRFASGLARYRFIFPL
ncbi:tricarboxylate transport protein, mitochondrial precursor [Dactylonectria estremocensis]|uniref:Tricarboxylate transport protein, mitochondrial n=1 Tax=Dactylonectria estremocensis TaxID=1079267 RepID=A0A9P9F9R4_9HYPO|nr:tricarboxylate transport protein, mitochondrial precursor [Dactylonectria estremocensis]